MKRWSCAVMALFVVASPAFAAPGVVSSADPRATAAGREMLEKGGSAADAALAMMLALSVVEPQSSGIGGGGFFVVHDGATGTTQTINGRETAPSSARPEMFLDAAGKPMPFVTAFVGGRSVGVPGNIALAAEAHKRWGKLPWATLFQPAIRLAKGYTVSKSTARALASVAPVMKDFKTSTYLYWSNGEPKRAGDIIRNPDKARLLGAIARHGPSAFYRGDNARAIVRAVGTSPKAPAPLTVSDLAGYRVVSQPAVCAPYRQYRLCGMGPPSSGATTVFQILGMLERFDMARLGKDSPIAWHLIGEAMQLAYADREKYLGDPAFVSVPVAGLLDRGYVASRSALIREDAALPRYEAGVPPGAEKRTAAVSGEVAGTTHFVAADRWGSVVSMTSTIEGPFGSQIVANGVSLNNELTDFTFAPVKDGAPVANAPAAGKRPLSSMSPTIVYGPDGKVVFAVGSAGGKRIIMHVAKALIGKLDWGLTAQEALTLPNIYFAGGKLLVEDGTTLSGMADALTALGQPVVKADLGSKLNALERDGDGWRGAADPRSEGTAAVEAGQ